MTPKEKAEELVDKFHIKVYVSFIENILYSIKSQYLFIRIPVSEYGSNNFFLDVL